MAQLRAIKLHGARERRAQIGLRLPPELSRDQSTVRVIVADVDFLSVAGKFTHAEFTATVDFDQQAGEIAQRNRGWAAEIEHRTDRLLSRRGKQERVHGIVDIGEIAQLLATPDLD